MELPRKLEIVLENEAKKRGTDPLLLLYDKLLEDLDPSQRVSLYISASEKFLNEANEYLEKGDLVQASEKAWGACASIVKAYGEKHGLEHYRHRDLEEIVSKLVSKNGKELGLLWGACIRLHSNFYENFMVKDDVKMMIEAVNEFVGRIKVIIENGS